VVRKAAAQEVRQRTERSVVVPQDRAPVRSIAAAQGVVQEVAPDVVLNA